MTYNNNTTVEATVYTTNVEVEYSDTVEVGTSYWDMVLYSDSEDVDDVE